MSVSDGARMTRLSPGALVECGNGDTGLLVSMPSGSFWNTPHVSERRPVPAYRLGGMTLVQTGAVWFVLVGGILCWEHKDNLKRLL